MDQGKYPKQGAKEQQISNQEQLPFSGQLRQNIINQPCDLAILWGCAADSFPQISANNVFAPLLQSWSVSLSAHWRCTFYPRPSFGFDYIL